MPSNGRATNPSFSVSYSTASASIETKTSAPHHYPSPGPPYAKYWQFGPCESMQTVYSTSPWRSLPIGQSTWDATKTFSKTREKNEMVTLKRQLAILSSWLSSAKPNFSSRVRRARKSLMPFGGTPFNQECRISPTCVIVVNASIRHEAATL